MRVNMPTNNQHAPAVSSPPAAPLLPCCCSCRYKMSSEKLVHRLVLSSVRLSDAGQYTVVAGSSMSKGHLGVEGRDVKISEPSSRDVTVSVSHRWLEHASMSLLLSNWKRFLQQTTGFKNNPPPQPQDRQQENKTMKTLRTANISHVEKRKNESVWTDHADD